MNFNLLQKFKCIKTRWISRTVFFLALLLIIGVGVFFSDKFVNYTELILVVVTMFYVFFTYEILMSTRESRPKPYIDIKFIGVSKLNEKFLKNRARLIRPNEKFLHLSKEYNTKTESFNKNIIFVIVDNWSGVDAVDIVFHITYDKKNFGIVTSDTSMNVELGNLKKGEKTIYIVDVYESPTQEDYFKIKDCWVKFNDVNGKWAKEKPAKEDFSNTATMENLDSGVSIIFKPKS